MPAPGFGAYCEVSAETFALTMACITSISFVARCLRSTAPINLSGLGGSLSTGFYSLYGLTYWFNGMNGYSCATLATVTGSCLALSNALVLLLLFIKADTFNLGDSRWKRYRWLGLLLTAMHWGTMVGSELLVVGHPERGLDGMRCAYSDNASAFMLKWVSQTFSQIFQSMIFIYPLRTHLLSAARARFKPSKRSSNWILFRNPLWRGVTAVSSALLVTLVLACFAFAKALGQLPNMPMFAVEVVHNAVNVATILFAVDVHQPKSIPKRSSRYQTPKLVLPARYRSRVYTGGGYGSQSYSYHNRAREMGGLGSSGSARNYAARMGASGRPASSSNRGVAMPLPPSRRYNGSIKRLPPVADMSPEAVTSACSPSGGDESGELARSQTTSNALFFAGHPKKKWIPPGGIPLQRSSSATRRFSGTESSASSSTPRGTTPTTRKVAPRRAWPPASESSVSVAERWGLGSSIGDSSESITSISSEALIPPAMETSAKAGDAAGGFQAEKVMETNQDRSGSKDRGNASESLKVNGLTPAAVTAAAIKKSGTGSNGGDNASLSSAGGQSSRTRPAFSADSVSSADSQPGHLDDAKKNTTADTARSPASYMTLFAD